MLDVIRRAVARRLGSPKAGVFRVWVPPCSQGGDPYPVAISMLEALGARGRDVPFRVLSTYAEADAFAPARTGLYPSSALQGMPDDKRRRYFVRKGGGFQVRPFVREHCRFVRWSAAQSPPFRRLDLIVCRNATDARPLPGRLESCRMCGAALAVGGLLVDREGRCLPAAVLQEPKRPCRRSAPRRAALPYEREEWFKALFYESESAQLVVDVVTDAILDANAAAERLYGWSRAELCRLSGKDLEAPPSPPRGPEQERRSPERLRTPQHRRKDGKRFPVDVKATFLMLSGDASEIWTVRDATERLRSKAVRARAEAENVFVGEVIHELRSPLTAIRCVVEMLRGGCSKARERRGFLRSIESQTGRMGHLIDRLLDLSAAHSGRRASEPAAVDLQRALWELVSEFVPVARRRGVTITVDIAEGLTALAAPADLPHVFGNLLDNAVKFNRRGGRIEVRGWAEGNEAVVTVRDTGPGIPPEDLSRVFERFYRSELTRATKGTGLGLAIVREIVSANRGRIWATNALDSGTVFHVALPAAPRRLS